MKNKVKSLSTILYQDFHYNMELVYDRERHCDEHASCRDEGICRCSTIHNVKIASIDLQSITDEFLKLSNDTFTLYCINRAIVNQKLWETDNWDISTCGGYYGEEIESVKLIGSVKNRIEFTISQILSAKDDKEKLFIVLRQEYGYILPELEDREFEIREVPTALINAGAEDHYRKLEKDIVKSYENYTLPIGVGIMKKGRIRLIDGYHRLAAQRNKLRSAVLIIVGS